MNIKIKSLVVNIGDHSFPAMPAVQNAALEIARGNAIKKAWAGLVGALETTTGIPVGTAEVISFWAEDFSLGNGSKKVDALARKKLKVGIEEKVKEARFNLKEARDSGLVDRTLVVYIRDLAQPWLDAVVSAEEELPAADKLDPLPVTQGELDLLVEAWEEREARYIEETGGDEA